MNYQDYGYSNLLSRQDPLANTQYTAQQLDVMMGVGSVGGSMISKGGVRADQIMVGTQPFVHNIPFNSAVQDTLVWSSGSIQWGDGTDRLINAGSVPSLLAMNSAFPNGGAILLYHFDESSGTSIADSGGNNLTGTATGASASSTQKRFGGFSRFFNGTSDYINIPYNNVMNISQHIQIEASIYPTAIGVDNTIIAKRLSTAMNYGFRIGTNPTDVTVKALQFYYVSTDGVTHVCSSADNVVDINQWYDVKVTYTFGNRDSIKFYVNGVQVTSRWSRGTGSSPVTPTNIATRIGSIDGSQFFQGYIDELRIKNSIDPDVTLSPRYVFYDSTADLKVTTDYAETVGDNLKLIAIWYPKLMKGASSVNVLAGTGTVIDADSIRTGRLSSTNGGTYFDLNRNRIIMNDGNNDILGIGDI